MPEQKVQYLSTHNWVETTRTLEEQKVGTQVQDRGAKGTEKKAVGTCASVYASAGACKSLLTIASWSAVVILPNAALL